MHPHRRLPTLPLFWQWGAGGRGLLVRYGTMVELPWFLHIEVILTMCGYVEVLRRLSEIAGFYP